MSPFQINPAAAGSNLNFGNTQVNRAGSGPTAALNTGNVASYTDYTNGTVPGMYDLNFAGTQNIPGMQATPNYPSLAFGSVSDAKNPLGFFDKNNTELGFNANTAGLAFGGLSALSQLYTGLEGLKLAKEQYAFGKESALRNERNAVRDYNTNLEAKEGRKAIISGKSPEEARLAFERNKAIAG